MKISSIRLGKLGFVGLLCVGCSMALHPGNTMKQKRIKAIESITYNATKDTIQAKTNIEYKYDKKGRMIFESIQTYYPVYDCHNSIGASNYEIYDSRVCITPTKDTHTWNQQTNSVYHKTSFQYEKNKVVIIQDDTLKRVCRNINLKNQSNRLRHLHKYFTPHEYNPISYRQYEYQDYIIGVSSNPCMIEIASSQDLDFQTKYIYDSLNNLTQIRQYHGLESQHDSLLYAVYCFENNKLTTHQIGWFSEYSNLGLSFELGLELQFDGHGNIIQETEVNRVRLGVDFDDCYPIEETPLYTHDYELDRYDNWIRRITYFSNDKKHELEVNGVVITERKIKYQ